MKRLINYPVGVISSWADGAFNWLILEKRGLWGYLRPGFWWASPCWDCWFRISAYVMFFGAQDRGLQASRGLSELKCCLSCLEPAAQVGLPSNILH